MNFNTNLLFGLRIKNMIENIHIRNKIPIEKINA
jgi:hypothetical protein